MKIYLGSLKKTIYKILDRTILSIFLTVLSLSQNMLELLEKYKKESCVFFIKVNLIFLKGQYGSTRSFPDSSFVKDA